MKRFLLFALTITIIFSVLSENYTHAQKKKLTYKEVYENSGNMRAMMFLFGRGISWYDGDNYLETKADPNKPGSKPNLMIVNAEDGRSETLIDYSSYELPEGFSLDRAAENSKDYNSFLFNLKNDLYYFNRTENAFKRLTNDEAEEKVPHLSPDGKKVAYVKENNLFVYDTDLDKETKLTTDGAELIYNGWASWVYMEEILGRATRYSAYWWSPNSDMISFLRFDDSSVPEFPLFRADGQHGELEKQRYPKAGDPNPYVKFGIAHISDGNVVWADFEEKAEHYIAWPTWTSSNKLTVQWMNREQNNIIIYNIDVNNGNKTELYNEKQSAWVEWFEDLHFLKNNGGFILRTNIDGFAHLYHYDLNGKLKKRITKGEWEVTSINLVDEKNQKIFFTGWKDKSTERHLFSVNFDGSGLKQITSESGTHSSNVSPNGKYFIDTYSNISTPHKAELFSTTGTSIRVLNDLSNPQNKDYELAKVELFTIPSGDGYNLPALWYLPENLDKTKKHPVIISIYGGPNSGTVRNSYPFGLSGHYMAQNGIITLSVDHRGSGHFGKKGVDLMHRVLGKWELSDYTAAVKWLKTLPFIDSTKIGITGGSYGGYVTALALTKGADYFTHGIAEFGVMDWKLYDNVYTERFMDTPNENPDGYKESSVLNYVDKYKGKMLITHGTMDDNVHMQNSIQLIYELEKLNKDFEMLLYPNQRHGIGYPLSLHASRERVKFWFKYFLGKDLDTSKD